MNKKTKKNFNFKINQLKEELKTDRHILACLGSIGLTFISDINLFKNYLDSIGEWGLLEIINNNKSLTKIELKKINEDW